MQLWGLWRFLCIQSLFIDIIFLLWFTTPQLCLKITFEFLSVFLKTAWIYLFLRPVSQMNAFHSVSFLIFFTLQLISNLSVVYIDILNICFHFALFYPVKLHRLLYKAHSWCLSVSPLPSQLWPVLMTTFPESAQSLFEKRCMPRTAPSKQFGLFLEKNENDVGVCSWVVLG